MAKSNKILAIKIFIGCLFIFSGVVKLFPIIAFEVQLISHGIMNWHAVTILARVTIAFEIFLGLCFLQNNYIKRIFIPAAIALLSIFTLDLVRAVIYLGFSGDCGCFGQVISMTPLEAIIKNIILIAGLIYLYRLIEVDKRGKWLLPALFIIITFVPVFLLFPAKHYEIQTPGTRTAKAPVQTNRDFQFPIKKVDTATVQAIKANPKLAVSVFRNFSGGITVDFRKGTEIVAVLNTECGDCIETAKGIGQLNKEMKLPPVYFLLLSDEKQVPEFINKTKTNYPYRLLDEEEFFTLIKGSPPRVWLLQNGKILGDWNFRNFSVDNLKNAVKKLH